MVFPMCASQTMDLSFHRKNSKCLVIKWQFENKTSSPGYPQSKGKAEQAAKAAKTLMKKAKKAGTDPYLSLLSHRNTATQGLDSSPVQRLTEGQKPYFQVLRTSLYQCFASMSTRSSVCASIDKLITTIKELKTWKSSSLATSSGFFQ